MAPSISELEHTLSSWLSWYRFRRMVNWAGRGLTLGLMIAFGFAVVARLRAVLSLEQLIQIAVLASALGAGWGAVAAWLWPTSQSAAARYFDLQFGLGERTSTALELARRKIVAPEWLARDQLADALNAARAVNPRARLPIHVRRIEWVSLLLAAALVAASLAIPNRQFAVLAQQQAVQQAVAQQVKALEAIRQQIKDDPRLTDAQKEQLTQPLNEAIAQLQTGALTRQQAVSALTQAQQQLQQLADPNALAQGQALQSAGQQLSQNSASQAVGEALQNNDLNAAAQALGSIDTSQMSAAQQQQLAQSLSQAASQLQSTNPQLAQQLQSAADALQNGDTQAAQSALSSAANALSAQASQVTTAQAAAAAAGQVANGQQSMAQAGQAQQGAQGQGQGGQQGQGQNGQSQNGQGASQGQGQGQGGGAGRGESDGGTGQGGEAGSTTGPSNNGPGDGGVRTYEPIYSPYHLGGTGGPEAPLAGTGDPGSEVVGEGPSRPPTSGAAQVPYNEVYDQYYQSAQYAIDSGAVPPGFKPVIKDYFSSLEP
ncbi:MAG: hypothetical protein HZB20_10110 [Chloroflexi bacterium]|nr:hypothetical protein [Chloroflexota bacterium]